MTAQVLLNALSAGVTPDLLRRYQRALGLLSYGVVRDADGEAGSYRLIDRDGACAGELRPDGDGLLRFVPHAPAPLAGKGS
jgi:hypothetical protein